MTYTIQIVCTPHGCPRKIVEVNEESLKKNPGPIDNMNDAFLTQFSPFSPPPEKRPRKIVKRKVVVNGIIEFDLQI